MAAARTEHAMLMAAACALLLLWPWWVFEAFGLGRPDNGDAYRIVGRLDARDRDGRPVTPFGAIIDHYRLAPGAGRPAAAPPDVPAQWSTAALVARASAAVAAGLGASQLRATTLALVYLPLLLLGFLVLVEAGAGSFGALLAYALATAGPYALSWLRSPFEEAATFALLPLWLAMTLAGWASGSRPRFAAWLLATFLLGNTKVIWVLVALPLLALTLGQGRARRAAGIAVALLLVALAAWQNAPHRAANGFQRVFFGICLTENAVALRPERTLHDRDVAFRAAPPPCADSLADLGLQDYARWSGRGFWPDAAEQLLPAEVEFIRARSGLADFVRVMLVDPLRAVRFVLNTWGVAARSDYRVGHLPISDRELPWPDRDPTVWAGGFFWLLGIAALAWGAVAARTGRGRFAAGPPARRAFVSVAVLLVVAPLAVVAGNGFADFEKQALPFVQLGLLSLVCTVALARPRRRRS